MVGNIAANGERLWRLPVDASLHGPALDAHLLLNLWIALGLLTLAHVLFLAGLLRRRRRQALHSQALFEFLPLAALALLFGTLAVRAETLWRDARYTGASPTALQVEVTGMQFAWYFRYPGPDATFGRTSPELVAPGEGNPVGLDATDRHATDDFVSGQLVLPAGREVDLRLRALDVIHGFSVPAMRIKQNAVPARTSTSTSRRPRPATTPSFARRYAAPVTIAWPRHCESCPPMTSRPGSPFDRGQSRERLQDPTHN